MVTLVLALRGTWPEGCYALSVGDGEAYDDKIPSTSMPGPPYHYAAKYYDTDSIAFKGKEPKRIGLFEAAMQRRPW